MNTLSDHFHLQFSFWVTLFAVISHFFLFQQISRFPGAGETLPAWSSHEMAHQHEPLLDCRAPASTVKVEEECHPTRSNCFDKPRISQQVHAKTEKPVFQRSSSVTPTFQKTLTFTHLEGKGNKSGVQMVQFHILIALALLFELTDLWSCSFLRLYYVQ